MLKALSEFDLRSANAHHGHCIDRRSKNGQAGIEGNGWYSVRTNWEGATCWEASGAPAHCRQPIDVDEKRGPWQG